MKPQDKQELHAQVDQVRGRLDELTADLRRVDDEVDGLATQRMHHDLLDQACGSLEKLGDLGVASLFWGESADASNVQERLRDVRGRVDAFHGRISALEERRQSILDDIDRHNENLEILGEDLDEILEQEERRKQEWIVERDESPLPPRVQAMAWTRGGEDDRRFRKTLWASLAFSVAFGSVLPMIDLPIPERFEPDNVPRRLAQLVRQEQAKLVPPPPVRDMPEDRPEPEAETPPDPTEPPPEPQDIASAQPQTPNTEPNPSAPLSDTPGDGVPDAAPGRRAVQKAGILAFKDSFASLARDDVSPRLGADARLGDAEEASRGENPSRSMLTTNAPGSSGGINIGSLSRNVGRGGGGGGGGGGIQGVEVGRASSPIAAIGGGGGGGGRPRAGGGPGLGRTDEEIQIVFDRYKSAFYRLYNRELRKDPTLRGQMVLRLTIEPDGSVSMCELQSTDMNAPTLARQVVDRVLTIDFGAKEGVKALTIVYPIDFLPAA